VLTVSSLPGYDAVSIGKYCRVVVLDFSGSEDGDRKLLLNVGNYLPVDTASFTYRCRNSVLSTVCTKTGLLGFMTL